MIGNTPKVYPFALNHTASTLKTNLLRRLIVMPSAERKQKSKSQRKPRRRSRSASQVRARSSTPSRKVTIRPTGVRNRRRQPSLSHQPKKMASAMSAARQAIVAASSQSRTRIGAIARAYALPLESSPIRYSSALTARPTAVAHPKSIYNITFAKPVGEAPYNMTLIDGSDWPLAGEMFVALSRSPTMNAVVYAPNPTCNTWQYSLKFGIDSFTHPDPSAMFDTQFVIYFPTASVANQVLTDLPVVSLEAINAAYVPLGVTEYYGGIHCGKRGFWLDGYEAAGTGVALFATLTMRIDCYNLGTGGVPTAIPSSSETTISLFKLKGGAWCEFNQMKYVGTGLVTHTTLAFAIKEPGYYAIDVLPNYNPSGTNVYLGISGVISGAGPNMVHCPVPGLTDKLAHLSNICVHAASAMLSPQCAAYVENGRVSAVQLPCADQWFDLMGSSPVNKISEQEGSANMPFAKGIYGFLKPCNLDDFKSAPLTTRAKGLVTGMANDLFPTTGWIVLAARVVDVPDQAEAATCYVTIGTSVEYTTTDQWVNAILPRMTPEEFSDAMRLLGTIDQWHENPMHFADIINFVRNSASKAMKWAPTLLRGLGSAASVIAPEYAAPIAALQYSAESVNHWRRRR